MSDDPKTAEEQIEELRSLYAKQQQFISALERDIHRFLDERQKIERTIMRCADIINGEFGTYKEVWDSFAPLPDYETALKWLIEFDDRVEDDIRSIWGTNED